MYDSGSQIFTSNWLVNIWDPLSYWDLWLHYKLLVNIWDHDYDYKTKTIILCYQNLEIKPSQLFLLLGRPPTCLYATTKRSRSGGLLRCWRWCGCVFWVDVLTLRRLSILLVSWISLLAANTHMHARTLTHSLTHSLKLSLTHTLTHTHAHTHTHTRTHTHKHKHTLTHSLTHSHTHMHTHSLTHSLTHSFTHSLTDSLT